MARGILLVIDYSVFVGRWEDGLSLGMMEFWVAVLLALMRGRCDSFITNYIECCCLGGTMVWGNGKEEATGRDILGVLPGNVFIGEFSLSSFLLGRCCIVS